MPELPEVETIARGLRELLPGRRIMNVSVPGRHLTPEGDQTFRAKLENRIFLGVQRRGKVLILELDTGFRLAFHLRMAGWLGLMPAGSKHGKHVHLLLTLDNQATLFFQDQRKFGTCKVFGPGELEKWSFYACLGPEPLEMPPEGLAVRLAGKRGRIKALLLDQRLIAGIGNIYADESLFRAGIHPATPARMLKPSRIRRLFAAVRDVLAEAVAAGGSSIRDYRTAAGLAGTFQEAFQVYGRVSLPCPRCNGPISSMKVAGRTSSYCPRCQKLPRAGKKDLRVPSPPPQPSSGL